MHITDRRPDGLRAGFNRIALPGSVALCILILLALFGGGCARLTSGSSFSPTDRDTVLRQIAADYARSGDLAQAQGALNRLGVANPAQLLLTLAEADLAAGRPRDEIESMARLAEALGQRSPKLIAYLEPTVAPTPIPPTATPLPPTEPPSPTQTPRPATETPTPEPPTATPSPEPQQPRVVADGDVNLRSGPGRAYPVVGRLQAGQETAIIARNANGDWWQIAWDGPGQAWVAGTVVRVLGPIDTVTVAEKIPPPPPTATRALQPTAAPPVPQNPGVQYVVASLRLRAVGEHSQRCDGGDHNIFVTVVDATGNPLDNVRVREIFSGQIYVTGAQGKGPGRVEYDIYRGGGGQIEIVNEVNERISEVTRGMSADWPDFDLMKAAGYCNCKPHPDDASCAADLNNRTYLFALGHYVYEVVFRRTH